MTGGYPTNFVNEGYRLARDHRDIPDHMRAGTAKARAVNLKPDPDEYKLVWPGHQAGELFMPPDPDGPLPPEVGLWGGAAVPFVTDEIGAGRPLVDFMRPDDRLQQWIDETDTADDPLSGEGSEGYRVADGRHVPVGTPGLLAAGSQPDEQASLFFPLHQFVAQHRGFNLPVYSTPVFDITDDGALDHSWAGGAHTQWRVELQHEGGKLAADGVCVPAMNFTRSGGDGTGWGTAVGQAEGGALGPVLTRPEDAGSHQTMAGAHGNANAAPPPAPGLAGFYLAAEAAGPLCAGAMADRHRLGVSGTGMPWQSGHIHANFLLYADEQRDAGIEWKTALHPRCGAGPVPWHVELRYDPAMQHTWMGERKQGLWRWHTTNDKRPPKPPTAVTEEPTFPWKPPRPWLGNPRGGPPPGGGGGGGGGPPAPGPVIDPGKVLGGDKLQPGAPGAGAGIILQGLDDPDAEITGADYERWARMIQRQAEAAGFGAQGDAFNIGGGQGAAGIDYEAVWGIETAGQLVINGERQADPARTPWEVASPGRYGVAIRNHATTGYDGRFGGPPVDHGPNLDPRYFPNVNRTGGTGETYTSPTARQRRRAASWVSARLASHWQTWGGEGAPTLAGGSYYLTDTVAGGDWFTPPEIVIDAVAPSTTSLTYLSLYNGLFGTTAVGSAARLGFLTPNQSTGGAADGWYMTASGNSNTVNASWTYLDASGSTRVGTLTHGGTIKPGGAAADLGALSDPWANVYATDGSFAGDVSIGGKLTVTGGIDPDYMQFTRAAANAAVDGEEVDADDTLWVDDGTTSGRTPGTLMFGSTPLRIPGVEAVLADNIDYAPDDESVAYTGIDNAQGGTVYAKLTDLNALRIAVENLRDAVEQMIGEDGQGGVFVPIVQALVNVGVVGAPPFSHADTFGDDLVEMWRADTGITKDGSNLVESWVGAVNATDLTASSTARPTWEATGLGGQNALSFDGSTDFIKGPFGSSQAQPTTYLIVMSISSWPSGGHLLDSDLGSKHAIWHQTGTGNATMFAGNNQAVGTTASWATGSALTGIFAFNTTTSYCWRNGTVIEDAGNVNTQEATQVCLGAVTNGTGFVTCKIAEVVVVGAVPTAEQMNLWLAYVQARYGISYTTIDS